PFFRIVKPTLEYGFDYRAVTWEDKAGTDAAAAKAGAITSGT
ncbi:lipo-like protein, partial [Mesorhizobium sp. M6A.T.Ca.TU.002.02.2.1]